MAEFINGEVVDMGVCLLHHRLIAPRELGSGGRTEEQHKHQVSHVKQNNIKDVWEGEGKDNACAL